MADTTSHWSTVLVVDDEQAVVDLVSAALSREGLTIRTALTGEEAVRIINETPLGAVVTDKNLPGLSGIDVIRVVKQKQPFCACVVITAFVSTASALEALRLGANDYILKPFDSLPLVAQRIKRALEYQRTLADRAALVEELRRMEQRLRTSQSEAFQRRTELDLFQNVVELRIEESTRELMRRVAMLEGDLASERSRRATLRESLRELARVCREEALQVPVATAGALERVAEKLAADAEILT